MLAAARRAPGATTLMFLDEPGLTAALEPGFPLGVDDTLDLVSAALAAIEGGAIAGLHCCGRADWPVVLQAGPQVLSLPVDAGARDHPGAFADFLERGGWMAWGRCPPTGPWARPPRSSGAGSWASGTCWPRPAASPLLLVEQALITPACGLVGLDVRPGRATCST